MSIDAVARRAGENLREEVMSHADVDSALEMLHATRRRRRRARVVASGLMAAALVTAALALGPFDRPVAEEPQPSRNVGVNHCVEVSQVRCPVDGTVVVEALTPYAVHLPNGFDGHVGVGRAPGYVDFYQLTDQAGVTVLSDATAAPPGPPELTTRELASWVAGRKFLDSTPVVRTAVDGLPAWQVDVALRPGALRTVRGWCNEHEPCRALLKLTTGSWETGPWRTMLSRYTFVDVPGPGTVAIWSWAFDRNEAALRVNERLVSTLSFHPGG